MKKKVLHVSAGGLNPGGVGSVIFSIVESLSDDFDFDCVVFNRRSDREEDFKQYGNIHRIPCYPTKGKRDYLELITRPFKLYWGIRRICKEEAYDVIHCHNQHDAWPCMLAAKHAKVQTRISHAHVGVDSRKRSKIERVARKVVINRVNKYATDRIACSKLAGEVLFLGNKYILIPNGVDIKKYSRGTNVPANQLCFIHVGRFTYAKNQKFVIETFAEICKSFTDAKLYLIGYGEEIEESRIRTLIKTCGICDNVEIIPGDTADIPRYYEKAEYMIFPSHFEGFPVTVLEAQSMEIVCYASEAVTTEANVGCLSILSLSEGPKKWAELIINDIRHGKKKSLDRDKLLQYSSENIAKQYAAVYNGEHIMQK